MIWVLLTTALALAAAAALAEPQWEVRSGQWRPDTNPFAIRQVWETGIWSEGWSEPEQFYPAYSRPAGSIHVYLRNAGSAAASIALSHVDGQPLAEVATTAAKAGRVIWCRVESPQTAPAEGKPEARQDDVAPSEWVECSLRLRESPSKAVRLRFDCGGLPLEVSVPVAPQPVRVESVSFSPAIDRIYLYLRSLDGKPVPQPKVYLDMIDAGRSVTWTQGPVGSGVALAEIRLDNGLAPGSFHLLEAVLPDLTAIGQTIRAWDSFFAVGLFGTVDDAHVAAAKQHGINAYFSGPSEILDKHGMYTVPHGPVDVSHRRAPGKPGALYYYNMDEPDAHDWRESDTIPYMDRLGLRAPEVLRIQREQRRADRVTPNLLLVDNTYKPLNWYVYGQIPDIFSTDPYVPLNGRQVDYVWQALDAARDACAPRPVVSVLWACGLDDPNRKFGKRPPTPEEERLMAFYAVGAGVKGIGYFIDLTQLTGEGQFTGLSDVPALWREVGKINADLKALSPMLATGCPAGAPDVAGAAWARTLMCGSDKLVVIAANTQHYIGFETRTEFAWNLPAKDVELRIPLPPAFEQCSVQRLVDGAFVETAADKVDGRLKLTLPTLDTAEAFLITSAQQKSE